MAVTSKNFGNAPDGAVTSFTSPSKRFMSSLSLMSLGFIAEVTNFGAILVNLLVPDKDGTMADVVLGFDKVDGYFGNGSFFGSTIGPSANRIDNASMEIDGVAYQLKVNDGKYVWLVILINVGLSLVTWYSILSSFSSVTVYVT